MSGRFNLLLLGVVAAGVAAGAVLASLQPASTAGAQAAARQRSGQESAPATGGDRAMVQGSAGGSAMAGQAGPMGQAAPAAGPGGPTAPGSAMAGQGGPTPQGSATGQAEPAGRARGQMAGQAGAEGRSRPIAGSVVAVEGDVATLGTPQGEVKVKLSGARIQKTVEGTLDDLKPGQRVVVSAQQGADGSYSATGVQIAPVGEASETATGR